ncbi:MAG TPA: hypothetical protein VLT91_14150 [Rhizomicrobium sp.]|nr:hypothetical protein [Rhizomicrobium sp.]
MSAPGVVVPATAAEAPLIDWRAIIAGAVVAAGISFMLVAFGSAIGLSVASTAPTWRDSSAWLWSLSGLYLVFVALCSFGFGGYVAGRMRSRLRPIVAGEIEFRDGMHGVVAWALAILIGAVIALAGSAVASRAMAPSGGPSGVTSSVASENIIASELDELFRTDRALTDADFTYRRAEAGRILLKSSSHAGVPNEDRDYLSNMTATITGLSPADADARVNRVIAESRDEIHRARAAAVLQAFMVAAGLLIGLAVSWFSAEEGGREREAGYVPVWDWSWRRRYS